VASCAGTLAPPATFETDPPPRPGGVSPCAHVTRATLTADCLIAEPDQMRRVGMSCELHPGFGLLADTVEVSYGFVSSEACGEKPGLFINSRLAVSGGCVLGRPFAEVAYCPECRRVRRDWERARRR
jgi:hypothetical protein